MKRKMTGNQLNLATEQKQIGWLTNVKEFMNNSSRIPFHDLQAA